MISRSFKIFLQPIPILTVFILAAFALLSIGLQATLAQNSESSANAEEIAIKAPSDLKEPLLHREEVIENLSQKFTETGAGVISYIDTGPTENPSSQVAVLEKISDIQVHFHVANDSEVFERMTLNTGIQKGSLNHVRIEGATGYRWENGELVIAYIPLPPGGSSVVTVTGIPLISDSPVDIQLTPVLKNKKGEVVDNGVSDNKSLQFETSAISPAFHMGSNRE